MTPEMNSSSLSAATRSSCHTDTEWYKIKSDCSVYPTDCAHNGPPARVFPRKPWSANAKVRTLMSQGAAVGGLQSSASTCRRDVLLDPEHDKSLTARATYQQSQLLADEQQCWPESHLAMLQ